jgi:hypothetical protein
MPADVQMVPTGIVLRRRNIVKYELFGELDSPIPASIPPKIIPLHLGVEPAGFVFDTN